MLKWNGCFVFAVIDDLIASQSRFVVRTLRFPTLENLKPLRD